MLEQFLNHIRARNLCKATDKILLAVSGGIDSMTMLDLFRKAGFHIGVAHCNFQLRGEAADGDEQWVKGICKAHNIPFYSIKFDTVSYAAEHHLSLQMAARRLRYTFFEEIRSKHGYAAIATAHHHGDSLETILVNLARGTGIDGLKGVSHRNGNVIRPMLFASRAEIESYAESSGVAWREDSSNALDDYHRNLLRHHVIPVMEQINPNLESTIEGTLERLAAAHRWVRQYVEQFREAHVRQTGDQVIIPIGALVNSGAPAVLLWELVKNLGFNFQVCRDVLQPHQPGKKFVGEHHCLVVDRGELILTSAASRKEEPRLIDAGVETVVGMTGSLEFKVIAKKGFALNPDPSIAQVDAGIIRYPLLWRPWKPGDRFIPLGMDNEKKLSDFFIDARISLPDKDQVTVIESAGTIVWVVGMRIHDRFKITDDTSEVLTIKFRPGT